MKFTTIASIFSAVLFVSLILLVLVRKSSKSVTSKLDTTSGQPESPIHAIGQPQTPIVKTAVTAEQKVLENHRARLQVHFAHSFPESS